ncbi:MAG: tetratricopeptide repeat protein [Bacteroidota bacterium]
MNRNLFILFIFCFLFFTIADTIAQKALQDSLFKAVQNSKSDMAKANALNTLSFSYVNVSPDSTLLYGRQSLELAKKINYEKGIANADYSLGAGNFRKGDIPKALSYFEDCAAIAKKISDKTLAVKAYLGLGNVCYANGKLDSAVEYFQRGVLLCEEINDLPRLSTLLNNIGNLHSMQHRDHESISYYRKSLNISYQLKDTPNLAMAYSNLADKYKDLHLPDSARIYVDSSLFMAYICNDIYTQSLMTGMKGLIEFGEKNYDAALPYLNKCLTQFKTKGNKSETAMLWIALGTVYHSKNKTDSSLYCYLKAKELAESAGVNKPMRQAYEGLSSNYAKKKDFENAYSYLKKYLDEESKFLDSLNIQKVTELNAKYEADSRQRKIELLEKDKLIQQVNSEREKTIRTFLIIGTFLLIAFSGFTYYRYRERKKLSEKLSASLDELKQTQHQLIETEKMHEQENVRLRISRDIHDEIGSNLTKIALLSDMLSAESKANGSDEKHSLEKISEYARSVNSSLSEIVWSVNPKQDTLESLVAYMRNYIHSFLQDTGIDFKIDFPSKPDNRPINPEFKRAVFLVLKETLNNCVKHSKAKNIQVKLDISDNHFDFAVKDDGAGFDFENKSFFGNGLTNMEYRVKQVKGDFKILTSPQNGCEINISAEL